MALEDFIEQLPIGEIVESENGVVLLRNDTLSLINNDDGINNFYQVFDYPLNKQVVLNEIVTVNNGTIIRNGNVIVGRQAINGVEIGFLTLNALNEQEFRPIQELSADFTSTPPNVNLLQIVVNLRTKKTIYNTTLDGSVIKNGTITTDKLQPTLIPTLVDTVKSQISFNDINDTVDTLLDEVEVFDQVLTDVMSNIAQLTNRTNTVDLRINGLNTETNNLITKANDLENAVTGLTTEVMTDIPIRINGITSDISILSSALASQLNDLRNDFTGLNQFLNSLTQNLISKTESIIPNKDQSVVDISFLTINELSPVKVYINGVRQDEYMVVKDNGIITSLDFSPDKFNGSLSLRIEYV